MLLVGITTPVGTVGEQSEPRWLARKATAAAPVPSLARTRTARLRRCAEESLFTRFAVCSTLPCKTLLHDLAYVVLYVVVVVGTP